MQVPELGKVSEQEVSAECDLFSDRSVVVEDEVVMFLSKGSEEVKDVPPIVLTLFTSMWEGEDCSSRGLAPSNEPIPGGFDGL